ncbi:hypothetical protein DFP72DRAFT_849586 [Ephemerocybe angulata]|uniref:C2H2-type domain-containing protein n=1 Tax=Ephemerocybe angulata TaxID=980116 RepID=A0A8H6HVW8_9AGAR|nr:hypothetical protein DFP72DRAFT_849586 [Tulosesus angulatus]
MPADRTSKKTSAARLSASPLADNDIPEDRICSMCEKVINRSLDMARHMRQHDPSRVRKYQCTYLTAKGVPCTHSTDQKSNLKTHVRTKHTFEKVYCKYADCTFGHPDPAAVTRHCKKVHDEQPKPRAARAPVYVEPRKGKKVEEPSEPVASTSAAASPSPSFPSDDESEYSSDSSSYSTRTSQFCPSPLSSSSSYQSSREPSPLDTTVLHVHTPEPVFVDALFLQKFADEVEVSGYLENAQYPSLGYESVTHPDIVDEARVTALHLGYPEAVNPQEPFYPLFCDAPYFNPNYWTEIDANIQSSLQDVNFHPDTQELNEARFNLPYFTEYKV